MPLYLANTTTMKPRCRRRRLLPDELVRDILTRVLVSRSKTTLVRFQCVCKTWQSLISSPPFKHDQPLLVRMKVEGTNIISIDTYNDSQGTLTMINSFRYKRVPNYIRPVQTVRGLLCLAGGRYSYDDEILVCNPSTGELETLPPPPRTTIQGHMITGVSTGFGHVASTNEFKVVRFSLSQNIKVSCCQVLTLSTINGCSGWRDLATGPPYLPVTVFRPPFVHGALHLMPEYYHCGTTLDVPIVAFDVETEQYKEVQLPHHYYKRTCQQHLHHMERLTELQGYLCMAEQVEGHLALWLLKDYHDNRTWVKEHNIDTIRVDSSIRRLVCSWRSWPCAILDDGCVLFVNHRGYNENKLWCYDPRDNSFSIPIMGSDGWVTLHEERFLPPLEQICARSVQ